MENIISKKLAEATTKNKYPHGIDVEPLGSVLYYHTQYKTSWEYIPFNDLAVMVIDWAATECHQIVVSKIEDGWLAVIHGVYIRDLTFAGAVCQAGELVLDVVNREKCVS